MYATANELACMEGWTLLCSQPNVLFSPGYKDRRREAGKVGAHELRPLQKQALSSYQFSHFGTHPRNTVDKTEVLAAVLLTP